MKSKWYLFILPFICISAKLHASCLGGQVSLEGNVTSLVQCIQNDNPALFPQNNSSTPEATYFYVLTNNTGSIVTDFADGSGIDLDSYGQGIYRIYGFSYTGSINQSTLQPGLPFEGISSDACYSYSANYITVTRNSCEAVNCQGGNIFTNEGDTYISICSDGEPDVFTLTTTSSGNANYTFVITDDSGLIEAITTDNTFDFEDLSVGHYSIRGLSYHGELVESTIQHGQPAENIEADGFCLEFSVYNIGVDVVDCVLGEGCTRLYFSEYIEGSQNNRALEIYNPTPFPVNLEDYDLFMYSNGSINELPIMGLSGILQPGDVYVVTNAQASAQLLSAADVTGGVASFSGNDAIALMYNLEPIDIIGVIGQDPGAMGWTWQDGPTVSSTTNRTFVRKQNVNAPTTNWNLSRGQWHIYSEDDFSHIGTHAASACLGLAYLGFENSAIVTQEDVGTLDIAVQGFNITGPIEAMVSVIAGTAVSDVDYVNTFPVSLQFTPSETTQVISIEIIDDEEMEDYEYFTLQITEESGLVSFVNQTLTIAIAHSDQQYPGYSIEEITTNNSFGVADSLDVFCTIGGVVHGLNLNGAGTEFTLIENHAGIKVFDPELNHGYTVAEGDSIRVSGRVAQFFGMTMFYPDSISLIDSNHALDEPMVIISMSEEHESNLVKIECVTLVDTSQWTNLTSGFDVEVSDGEHQFTLHIDLDTDLYGTPPLQGHFNVVGIGAQKDETAPYDDNYSIWPRYIEDINGNVIASFLHADELIFGDGGATVSFENNSTGATTYDWDFGDTNSSAEESPTHFYPFSFFVGIADVTVTLTVSDGEGCTDIYSQTMDVVYSSVDEIAQASFVCYPNPFNERLFIQTDENISAIKVYDSLGKIIYVQSKINQSTSEIETARWSQGIYLVEITTGNAVVCQKVMKY